MGKSPSLSLSRFAISIIACLVLLALPACQAQSPLTPTATLASETAESSESSPEPGGVASSPEPADQTVSPMLTTEPVLSATPEPAFSPTQVSYPEGFWQDLPVIPESLSDAMREVYQKGIAMGNDPHIFTKLGDCNSKSPDFLHGFGGMYDLGEFSSLQPAIEYWKDSFRLPNQATNPGTTTSRLLVSLWTNDQCEADEIMLDCQYRLDNPSVAIIALGTIDAKYQWQDPQAFERNLRVIIEKSLERGIVPVVATKADNIEGDNAINTTIARLAMEYELPLWNYWKAVQPCVNHGLLPDMEHLNSWSGAPATDFSLPIALDYGKEVKNITALQMLDFLRQELGEPAATGSATTAP